MQEDLKGLYVAIVLSAFVVLGVNYFFPKPEKQESVAKEVVITSQSEKTENISATDTEPEISEPLKVSDVMAQDMRLPLKNDVLTGSVRLKGARFDNLLLSKYHETIEKNSPNVSLLAPAKTAESYFAEYGWLSADTSLNLPHSDTVWHIVGNNELTPSTPVTLVWENGQGLKFINKLTLDENYLFNIEQSVENHTGKAVTLLPYGLFSKSIDENSKKRSVVHEGFVGILNGKLKEIRYDKMKEQPQEFETTGGWVSFGDKYWFGSFIFADETAIKVSLRKVKDGIFQLDYKGAPQQIQNGENLKIGT